MVLELVLIKRERKRESGTKSMRQGKKKRKVP